MTSAADHALLLVDLGRDAAPVVGDRHRAVGLQHHLHRVAPAGERLVDGVVHHLIDHVVQAGAVVGVADIHAGRLRTASRPRSTLMASAPYSPVSSSAGMSSVGSLGSVMAAPAAATTPFATCAAFGAAGE